MTPREETKLLNENMGLIFAAVKRRNVSQSGLDDALQVGCMGALRAIREFDASRGTKLSALIFARAWGDVGNWLRKETHARTGRAYRSRAEAQLDAAPMGDKASELPDTSPSPDAAVSGREVQAAYARRLAGAPTALKLAADSLLAEESIADLAKKLGASARSASRRRQALCQFLEPLRDQLDLN